MAHGSFKRNYTRNKGVLRRLWMISFSTNLVYLTTAWLLGPTMWLLFLCSSLLQHAVILWLARISSPEAKVVRVDLSDTGNYLVQYLLDYVYITWAIHACSGVWPSLWLGYLVIPVYVVAKVASLFLAK